MFIHECYGQLKRKKLIALSAIITCLLASEIAYSQTTRNDSKAKSYPTIIKTPKTKPKTNLKSKRIIKKQQPKRYITKEEHEKEMLERQLKPGKDPLRHIKFV